jgi:hypothetical protein
MSEIGIYAGGYQRVRDYAKSVDRLLLDLKSGAAPDEDVVSPVVNLLEAMQQKRTTPPRVQLLGLRWSSRSRIPPARISGIVLELKKRDVTEQTVAELEDLANVLDQERADMRQRLRGV